MLVPLLYKTCLEKTSHLIKTGMWATCSPNPFSDLPSRIVDDVMENTTAGCKEVSSLLLLVESGKLTRLSIVFPLALEKEYDLFQKTMRTNCCKALRSLTLYLSHNPSSINLIETLISLCPNLEEFASNIFPNFEVFKNCKELRIIRFDMFAGAHDLQSLPVDYSALTSIRNLEVILSIPDMTSDMVAKALESCPQLVSLGYVDSLGGLKKIRESYLNKYSSSRKDICGHFQLRGCAWTPNFKKHTIEKSTFSEELRNAVSLCPLVEELVVSGYHGCSFLELKNLKRLALLRIDFCGCSNGCLQDFVELLHEIGPQLKYLSVVSEFILPVDIICDCCPNLLSLEILGCATVTKTVQKNCNLSLKQLHIWQGDGDSVLFLLSNCKGLEELILGNAYRLNDDLLNQILKLNPLSELQEIVIWESRLSREGFRMLLQKLTSLQRVFTAHFVYDMIKSLTGELNLNTLMHDSVNRFYRNRDLRNCFGKMVWLREVSLM
ncbi:hypothetical protein AVEN_70485-1 [Araneus ventricosus]|uniref:Uncharacterized protein n=1 Tax=Araneus ventricosus TaxID=182803 RepID=A0A4Y2GZV0_ARAVE|nr:hypothetical protein AVEN_70485-1 [Araneus ventricosus]